MHALSYRLSIGVAIGLCVSVFIQPLAYANYQRCWLNEGVSTINCDPADGYVFIKHKDTYKKCNVGSGSIDPKTCKQEDGYGLILTNHIWYQCPIQNGKKLDHCTLASGYQIVDRPHVPRL